jgi:hypothetical protein
MIELTYFLRARLLTQLGSLEFRNVLQVHFFRSAALRNCDDFGGERFIRRPTVVYSRLHSQGKVASFDDEPIRS